MRILPHNPWLKVGVLIFIAVVVILLVALLYGLVRSYQANKHPDNARFSNGTYPSSVLDGKFAGVWTNKRSTWLGKEFFADSNTGINNFTDGQRYRFKTYRAKSISKQQDILKIDYDIPGNPFWVRRIVDELVEIEPGHYQGKVYARFLPGLTFTITYFTLQK